MSNIFNLIKNGYLKFIKKYINKDNVNDKDIFDLVKTGKLKSIKKCPLTDSF